MQDLSFDHNIDFGGWLEVWVLIVSNAELWKASAEDMQTEQFTPNHIIHFKKLGFFHTLICAHLNLSLIYIKLPLITQMRAITLNHSKGVLPKTHKPRFFCTRVI